MNEVKPDQARYSDPIYDSTKVEGQPGLWANILIISGIAFKAVYDVLSLPDRAKSSLYLYNIDGTDFQPLSGHLIPLSGSCAVCDAEKIQELTV